MEKLYTFSNEDHTLGNLLRSAVLENENVLFSAYKNTHPLVREIQLQIVADEETPDEILRDAIEKKIKVLKELGKSI